ncbi:phage tail assembly chaperone [Massilia sp. YIM B02763]|uniref:phage tail assembly chaperone n=1 Tax=Massilia sp. YIM B02763 TaxID=3050130 RepID=UPI0025B6CFFB|nr:phage tail assembly chaperone [Massilia sp. YIM B02763]MDN4052909.1 phage tail assembly chaperone [Massilia sp. YIM B02763]
MAQKIKLGARPKSFTRLVAFPMIEGGEDGCIEVQFKYRTRKELAKLTDEVQGARQALHDADIEAIKAKADKNEPIDVFKQSDMIDRDISLTVDYLMQVMDGWNLDEKFDRRALEQLADEVPAALRAIVDTYRTAINEGRLGN